MTDHRAGLADDLKLIVRHDFDTLTMFCRKCGMSMYDVVSERTGCNDGPSVVGITHLIAARRFQRLPRHGVTHMAEHQGYNFHGEKVDILNRRLRPHIRANGQRRPCPQCGLQVLDMARHLDVVHGDDE